MTLNSVYTTEDYTIDTDDSSLPAADDETCRPPGPAAPRRVTVLGHALRVADRGSRTTRTHTASAQRGVLQGAPGAGPPPAPRDGSVASVALTPLC